jgi:hypothetical protein
MLSDLRTDFWRLRRAAARLRQQGHGWLSLLLIRLPFAAARRAYRRIAVLVNRQVLIPLFNDRKFEAFEAFLRQTSGKRFFVIVMPGVLHFLLPCLRLIPTSVGLVFIHNGSKRDEEDVLTRLYPQHPQFRLTTLPGSSLAHGDVLTLLLTHSRDDFGIIDHDLYVFDGTVFDRLVFSDGEALLGLFGGANQEAGLVYPHTFFLYFRAEAMRDLMERHGVTARVYRRAPRRLRDQLAALGLPTGRYLKDYVDFYDTLQLLIAIAYCEGLRPGFVPLADPNDAVHVGGTSSGTQAVNMNLAGLYVRALFLELACNALLPDRYRNTLGKFCSAAEIRPLLPRTPETLRMLPVLDRLMMKLESIPGMRV